MYSTGKLKKHRPNKILRKRKAICQGYTDLFEAMCTEVGIKSYAVDGYVKGGSYEPSDILVREEHVWNAVFYNGQWHLMDLTWGSGSIRSRKQIIRKFLFNRFHIPFRRKFKFMKDRNMDYIITDPNTFILDHLPAHPWWQLTAKVLPEAVFEKDSSEINKFIHSKKGEVNSFDANIQVFENFKQPYKYLFKAKKAHNYNEQNFEVLAQGKTMSALFWFNETRKQRIHCTQKIKVYDSCAVLLKEAIGDLKFYNEYTNKENKIRVKKNSDFHLEAVHFSEKQLSLNNQKINNILSRKEKLKGERKKLKKERRTLNKEIYALYSKNMKDSVGSNPADSTLLAEMDTIKMSIDSLKIIKYKNFTDSLTLKINTLNYNRFHISEASKQSKLIFKAKKYWRSHFMWILRPTIDTLQKYQTELSQPKDSLWLASDSAYTQLFLLIKGNGTDAREIRKKYKSLLSLAKKSGKPQLFYTTKDAWKEYDEYRLAQIEANISLCQSEKSKNKKIKKKLKKENKANRKEMKREEHRYYYYNWYYNKFCKYHLYKSGVFSKKIKRAKSIVKQESSVCKKKIMEEKKRMEKEKKEREKNSIH